MNTNVKAVINLMQTLGVTLDEVKKALPSAAITNNESPCGEDDVPSTTSPPSGEIEYDRTSNGMKYATYKGKVLGLVFNEDRDGFILSLNNNGQDVEINEAQKQASKLSAPAGKRWIVPEDKHWLEVRNAGVERVNTALWELGGKPLDCSKGYLSATSQSNRPRHWNVRFIMPIA